MSGAPVAGRRKGLAAVTMTAPSAAGVSVLTSAPAQVEVPAWLSETDTSSTPLTMAGLATATPSTHVAPHADIRDSVTHDDPLAFLNDTESEGAVSVATVAQNHHAMHAATELPPHEQPAAAVARRAGLEQEWQRLQAELAAIETDTRASQVAVAALQDESDPLCREVAVLAQALQARQGEYAAQCQQRAASARAAPQAQGTTTNVDDTAAVAALAQLETMYKQRVDELTTRLTTQCDAVTAAQAELTAVQMRQRERSTTQALEATALGQMQERLEAMVRGMRAKVTLQVQPMLARHIRAAMTAAAAQRRDIAAQDEQRRQRAVQQFMDESSRDWAAFRATQRAQCQEQSDRLVGGVAELLRQQQAKRTAFLQQCTARDTSVIAQATQQVAQAAQEALQRVARMTEEASVQSAQQDAEEERRLGERCRNELQDYVSRAAEAKRALCVRHRIALSHRAAEASTTRHCSPARAMVPSTKSSQERLRVTLLRLSQTILTQTRLAKEGLDRHGEQTAMARCGGVTAAAGDGASAAMAAATESRVAELRALRLRLDTSCGNAVSQLDMARRTLRERRARLLGLRAHVALTQRSWNEEVRAALSRVLVSRTARNGVANGDDDDDDESPETEEEVRMPQYRATRLVKELTRQVAAVCGGSARGRQARRAFVKSVQEQKTTLDVAVQRAVLASRALVALQERVSNAVVLAETRRAALSTRSTQISQLRDRVHRERRQLTYRRHELERAAERLQRSSNLFFDAAKTGESDDNDEPTPSLPPPQHGLVRAAQGRHLSTTRSSSAASSLSSASAEGGHGTTTALQASAMPSSLRPGLVCATLA